MSIRADLESIVFMKVGSHAGESLEDIIARKRKEYELSGKIFWGYGGGTMHPVQRVQPFVRMRVQQGATISILMEEIVSRHPPTEVFAKEYSKDGLHWEPLPKGVRVRGSRYALVLDEIQEGDLTFDLAGYEVGTGPSTGKAAADYIRGRVDKGCLVRTEDKPATEEHRIIKVQYAAQLQEPFAVLLRS